MSDNVLPSGADERSVVNDGNPEWPKRILPSRNRAMRSPRADQAR